MCMESDPVSLTHSGDPRAQNLAVWHVFRVSSHLAHAPIQSMKERIGPGLAKQRMRTLLRCHEPSEMSRTGAYLAGLKPS